MNNRVQVFGVKQGSIFLKTPPPPGRGISADVTWSEKYDKGSKKKKKMGKMKERTRNIL